MSPSALADTVDASAREARVLIDEAEAHLRVAVQLSDVLRAAGIADDVAVEGARRAAKRAAAAQLAAENHAIVGAYACERWPAWRMGLRLIVIGARLLAFGWPGRAIRR